MPGSVSTLVMVGQDPKPGKNAVDEERNMLAFGKAWAKQVYGCSGGGCVVTFTTYDDFKTQLGSFTSIGKLAILAHSGGDTLEFRWPDGSIELKSLSAMSTDLAAMSTSVSTVEFLGCQVGRDPVALFDFADKIGADVAYGHNYFHAFQPLLVPIDPGETETTLETRLGDRYDHLLAGTDLSAAAAKKGKKVPLWIEWFMIRKDKRGFDEFDGAERKKSLKRRTDETRIQLNARSDAQNLKPKVDNPVPVFTKVEAAP
jgi:hypothetical protein